MGISKRTWENEFPTQEELNKAENLSETTTDTEKLDKWYEFWDEIEEQKEERERFLESQWYKENILGEEAK